MPARTVATWTLVVLDLTATAARAAGPVRGDEDPVLEALVAAAVARSPEVRAAAAMSDAGRARADAAGAAPDPTIAVGYTNDGFRPSLGTREMTTLGATWSQPLVTGGKRGVRTRLARQEAARDALEVARARIRVASEVRRAYHGYLLAGALAALATEEQATWDEMIASARARYEVGTGTQAEVFRAQVERTRARLSVLQAESDRAGAGAALERLLDRPAAEIEPAPLELRPLARAPEEIERAAEGESPELRAAASDVERERLGVSLAERERRPDVALQAGYMNRGGLDPMWQAGVAVTLPFSHTRIKAGIAEAQDRVAAAEARQEALRRLLRQRVRERIAEITSLAGAAELYREGILPQGRMALESALANYATGRVPLATVLDAAISLYRDRASYLRQIAAHEIGKARLYEWSLDNVEALPMGSPMGER